MATKIKFSSSGEVLEHISIDKDTVQVTPFKKVKRVRDKEGKNIRRQEKLMKLEDLHQKKKLKVLDGEEHIHDVADPVAEAVEKPKEETKEGEESSEPTVELPPVESKAKTDALAYLKIYANERAKWKFQKTWILQNIFYQHQLDNLQFKDALDYVDGAGQRAKDETVENARVLMEKDGLADTIFKRAKKIIKKLS